ncbi:efflux RND transporter periplasmic adaptor subunit [Stella sp.]|uniref:efflux RND transporter periplasmic adaptor subunit n=1 Tax=Stella sp. TaxID=2912054 RepID=UPI0035AFFB91
MRVGTQLLVIAIMAGVGGGGWYYWQSQAVGKVATATAQAPRAPTVVVDVVRAERGLVEERVESVGTARANEAVTVTAKLTGIVSAIGFREGQRVQAGDLLIELESRQARAELDEARANLDEYRRRLQRADALRRSGAVTEARYDEATALVQAGTARVKSMEARLADLRIVAPFAGKVGLRQVSLGNLVQPGTAVTTLDDVGRIKMEFALPEVTVGRLRIGLPVSARSAAYPGRVYQGLVRAIDTRIDPVTRSVRVNAEFDNGDGSLLPGMFLMVEMVAERREDAVLVPEEAVVPEGTRQYLFVVRDGRARRVEVTLGERLPGKVEIARGIAVGDQIILRGTQKIREGSAVTVSPASGS